MLVLSDTSFFVFSNHALYLIEHEDNEYRVYYDQNKEWCLWIFEELQKSKNLVSKI